MLRAAALLAIGTFALLFGKANSQIGITLCGCQPAVYEITLAFNVSCEQTNVEGPGITDTACIESREGNEPVEDFTPVILTDIQFLELNQNLQTIQQEPRDGPFRDGDVVAYSSVLNVITDFDEVSLPRAFQMVLRGFNQFDQAIQVTWVITYANDCGLFPILFEGQRIGWSIFVRIANASHADSLYFVAHTCLDHKWTYAMSLMFSTD